MTKGIDASAREADGYSTRIARHPLFHRVSPQAGGVDEVVTARRPAAIVTAVLVCAALAAGCTSSSGKPGPSTSISSTDPSSSPAPRTTTSTSTPQSSEPRTISSGPSDPRVAAAVKAYTSFVTATNFTYAHPPRKVGDPLPKHGDFRPFSFDPAQGKVLSYVFSLTTDGIEYRGTPPTPRTSVTSADLGAAPYPTVTLTDCPTAPANWTTYYRATGKPTGGQPLKVKPPYLVTVQVIFYKKHWGVYKLSPNSKRTCTPS
jgi:hypothetical protein